MNKITLIFIAVILMAVSNGCVCSLVLKAKTNNFYNNSNEIKKRKYYKGSLEGDTIINNDTYFVISINNALKVPKGEVIKLFIPKIEDSHDLSKLCNKPECINKLFGINQLSENMPIEVNVSKPKTNSRIHDIEVFRTVFHDKNEIFDKIINESIDSPTNIGISILNSDTTRIEFVYGVKNNGKIKYICYYSNSLFLKCNWRTENRLFMYESMKPFALLIDFILFPIYIIGFPIWTDLLIKSDL
jgi:hypothetical protein